MHCGTYEMGLFDYLYFPPPDVGNESPVNEIFLIWWAYRNLTLNDAPNMFQQHFEIYLFHIGINC